MKCVCACVCEPLEYFLIVCVRVCTVCMCTCVYVHVCTCARVCVVDLWGHRQIQPWVTFTVFPRVSDPGDGVRAEPCARPGPRIHQELLEEALGQYRVRVWVRCACTAAT